MLGRRTKYTETMATTLSEAYIEVPLNLKHIIPLDFKSLHRVPDSHVWPTEEINDDFLNIHEQKPLIPVVDFSAPNFEENLVRACETWGVFQLTNHGIPTNIITDVESQARRLFELPNDTKMKVLRSPGGATGYGVARMQPFFPKFMWHEGFSIAGSPVCHARELWPHDYESFW